MPDIHTAVPPAAPAGLNPAPHPMDPRRGDGLSPAFAAYLCWLLDLEPLTEPVVIGAAVSGECVFVATGADPFHDTLLGAWSDVEANLRAWGAVCETEPEAVERLIARARRGSR